MKMKKLVSGIAALTMVASAFSAMTFTASAVAGDVTTIYSEDFSTTTTYSADSSYTKTVFGVATESSATWLTTAALKFGSSSRGSSKGCGYKKALTDNTASANALSSYTNNVTLDFDLEALQIRSDGPGDIDLGFGDSSDNSLFALNIGTGSSFGTNTLTDASGATTSVSGTTLHFSVAMDFLNDTQTITVTDSDDNPVTTVTAAMTQSNFNGFYYPNSEWKYGYALVDNIVITTTEVDADTADYTIEYTLNGSTVKTVKDTAVVGTTITADKTFTEKDVKYYITADTAPTLTVEADADNKLTVPVRVANNYTVTVNATGDVSKTLSTVSAVEGETASYAFPQYIVDEGIAYEATANNSDPYYGGSVASIAADTSVNVTYTKAYEDVIFYDELDNSTDKNAGTRASNCSAYNNASYTSDVLDPGTYTAVVRWVNVGRGSSMTIGDTTLITEGDCTKYLWTTTTKEFTITEAASLVWNAGSAYDPIDTVLVYGTPDTTYEAGYTFGDEDETFTVSDLQSKTLTVTSSNGVGTYSLANAAWNTEGISDESNVKFGLILTDIPENVTITSVVVE